MRLHVVSDLHTEFYKLSQNISLIDNFDKTDVDIIVLAGDIFSLSTSMKNKTYIFMKHLCNLYKNVIFVPGNHDYFNVSAYKFKPIIKDWGLTNLIMLFPGNEFKYDKYRFIGGTMWYPFPEDPLAIQIKKGFIDFEVIQDFEPWVYNQNKEFRVHIAEKMTNNDIIISHHLPSYKSVSPQYKHYTANAFFVSDMEDLIIKNKPKLWIHGHTHDPFDYKIGESRIYCNPRGYPKEKANPEFKNRILIELE